MKKTCKTMTTEKRPYQAPAMQVIYFKTTPLLNNVSGSGLNYGGNGDGEYGD